MGVIGASMGKAHSLAPRLAAGDLFDKVKYWREHRRMDGLADHVEAVRRFNRFYTRRIGALRRGLAGSPFPLPEARVLYELAQRRSCTATELRRELGMDAGYLSRLLRGLRRRGLVRAATSAEDARSSLLSLSARGARAFAALEARTRADVEGMLRPLHGAGRERMVGAMRDVEAMLEGGAPARALLRDPRPGDMGRVVQMHGELYAREFGYDATFEALVAEIAAQFVRDFDPRWERCWIAELGGEVVGSVFLVRKSKAVAKLRLLVLDPKARGQGLGKRLTQACLQFAREKGYRKVVLWTQSHLAAARAIYKAEGFVKTASEKHRSFGKDLVAETWELALD
jgi:DNA-binding MarR family transcriptional regulator/N-acetylglutamate synthase-like GNAT family acetyltransferase